MTSALAPASSPSSACTCCSSSAILAPLASAEAWASPSAFTAVSRSAVAVAAAASASATRRCAVQPQPTATSSNAASAASRASPGRVLPRWLDNCAPYASVMISFPRLLASTRVRWGKTRRRHAVRVGQQRLLNRPRSATQAIYRGIRPQRSAKPAPFYLAWNEGRPWTRTATIGLVATRNWSGRRDSNTRHPAPKVKCRDFPVLSANCLALLTCSNCVDFRCG